MKTAAIMLGTATLVYGSIILDPNSKITSRLVIGTFVYMIMLSVVANIDSTLGKRLALLVLLGAAYLYGPRLVKQLGFSNG